MADELGPPDITLDGRLEPEAGRRYIRVGFDVPDGVEQIHVRYAYDDRISADPTISGGNTLDIGLFDGRGTAAGRPGFRGWSGSSRREFTVGAAWATPPYRAGAIGAGRWHVLLGPYKIGPAGLEYRVEIWLDPALPTLDPRPNRIAPSARSGIEPAEPGWLRADLHCHTRFSDGASWPEEMLSAAAEAGLDVLAITDHNSANAATPPPENGELPLLLPGVEVTTYGGHWNVWGGRGWYEFRDPTGPAIQDAVNRAIADGAFVSVNHPKPFGPPWAYDGVTGFQAVEVWNGPWEGRNVLALAYWEDMLRQGKRLIAVGGSDTHVLDGQRHNPAAPRLGQSTTWIGLEPGQSRTVANVLAALRAGRCFAAASPEGPRLYLSRRAEGVEVRVVGADGAVLMVLDQAGAVTAAAMSGPDERMAIPFPADSTYLRAQLIDGSGTMLAISNPVWRDPAPDPR